MLFTSYTFLAFLCVMLLVYYLVPKKIQWIALLVGSFVFYAFAGLQYFVFILFTTLSVYLLSLILYRHKQREDACAEANREVWSKEERKAYRARSKKKRFHILLWGLILNFGVLAVLKYTAFAVNSVNSLLSAFGKSGFDIPSLILPMGISFYTFQAVGYLIDVYRAKAVPEKNPAKLALFIAFFPQLVQGPISRFGDLHAQLVAPHRFDGRTFTSGLQRILWGYFKKLVIADRVLIAMNTMLDAPTEYKGAYVLLLVILYSVQIYADFTGGIDITLGIAETMGIKLAENFDRPFSSKSTKEYWRRWHITMGSWFRDYIFVPISVTRPMLKLNKKLAWKIGRGAASKAVAYTASTVTWLATGIWHGAGWNFIVWGLLNCFIMMVSEALEPTYKRFHEKFPRLTSSVFYGKFMAVRTFLLMGVVRSLDCYRNVGLTFSMWGSMLTLRGMGDMLTGGILRLGLGLDDVIIVAVAVAVVFAVSKIPDIREKLYERPALCAALCACLFTATVMLGAYGQGYDASQFIYNQF